MKYFKSRSNFIAEYSNFRPEIGDTFSDYISDDSLLQRIVELLLDEEEDDLGYGFKLDMCYDFMEQKHNVSDAVTDETIDTCMDDPDFLSFAVESQRADFESVTNNISKRIKNGILTLYRKMIVSDSWEADIQNNTNLGIYWAFDAAKAKVYWEDIDNGHEAHITADVNESSIDWFNTLYMNMILPQECEIRLPDNTELLNVSIDVDGVILNVNNNKFTS